MFVPPGGKRIGGVAKELSQTGIYNYWKFEYTSVRDILIAFRKGKGESHL